MEQQKPGLGRIVHYRLSEDDAKQINRRRTTGESIAQRIAQRVVTPDVEDSNVKTVSHWPVGAQAHVGNEVAEGDTFPMMITRLWGDTPESAVNGQVFLDGTDVLWATSVTVGEGPRTYSWPTRN